MSAPRAPRSTRDRPAKAPLSLEAIVDAAAAILRTEGLEALSMRRVAAALDTGAGSLYVYVPNRDGLLVDDHHARSAQHGVGVLRLIVAMVVTDGLGPSRQFDLVEAERRDAEISPHALVELAGRGMGSGPDRYLGCIAETEGHAGSLSAPESVDAFVRDRPQRPIRTLALIAERPAMRRPRSGSGHGLSPIYGARSH